MEIQDFLNLYKNDSLVQAVAASLKPNDQKTVQLKGLIGSADAVIASSIYQINHQNHLFILHDKEEAAYFFNDLQGLIGQRKEVLLFPTSYKKPYTLNETENANILMRAEILNRLNHKSSAGELIVTYPDALTEKVINKKALLKNTFTAKVGEQLDVEFIAELLQTYDFEATDFVYEAGQFAVRGGIIDVYSYASELPYRIELFGDEVDSIRTFDPTSQLSKEKVKSVNIIPNVQTKLLEEQRQSFLDFIPQNTRLWFKDYQNTLDVIDAYFEKATSSFEEIVDTSGTDKLMLSPEQLFETAEEFENLAAPFVKIEFGNRFYLKTGSVETFSLDFAPQPPFHKDFEMLTDNLREWQDQGYENLITAETIKQVERLENIFEELDPHLQFKTLNLGLRQGFIDKNLKITCYTDHQIFDRFHRFRTKEKFTKSRAITLKELKALHPGDYVVHIDHGVGRFAGMDIVEVNGRHQEVMRIVYRDDDLLYLGIHSLHKISRYSGKEGIPPVMNKLGGQEWENKKKRVKRKVKDIAKDLINLYAKRKAAPGYAYPADNFLQAELESSFIYQDTPDQATATEDVKLDMQQPHPMDRLVCGDVGFGKTEVAIRAAFKAVANSKQVAILVPTTILAIQHYHTFQNRLERFGVTVDYVNRFKSTKAVREIMQRLAEGKIDILIGTHRIVGKDVTFKDLGLMVIDEEQKFGVKVKEKLKEMRVNVDALTLTATPIPRTLHFSLMGARDLSVISTPPPNRQPVTTELHEFNESIIRDAISYEVRRGGQVFFVHNRVKDIEEVANIVHRLVPDARIGIAHGQMEGSQLEKVMMRFIEGEYDVLVSTNIVESGLDIPNANTIIINMAHMFGMSDLHQMRGRVGRSNKKAFCYLLTPPTSALTSDARKRLNTLEEFSELGDGFKVAMRDLDIRGAGNLLGGEQSGFINDLGFDMYHKVLDEAIQELKETEFKDLFADSLDEAAGLKLVPDCSIETDLELLIPEDYVTNISERLSLYTQLDSINTEEELTQFVAAIKDRFGPIPPETLELINSVRLRWLALRIGFEKLTIKSEVMRCYFVAENDEYYKSPTFGKILGYIQSQPKKFRLREVKNKLLLTVDHIKDIDSAQACLEDIVKTCVE